MAAKEYRVGKYVPNDGDIVLSGWKETFGKYKCEWVAIVKGDDNEYDTYDTYAGCYLDEDPNYKGLWIGDEFCNSQQYTRLASNEEKAMLMERLKEHGFVWTGKALRRGVK